jgi:hypothetical protein
MFCQASFAAPNQSARSQLLAEALILLRPPDRDGKEASHG